MILSNSLLLTAFLRTLQLQESAAFPISSNHRVTASNVVRDSKNGGSPSSRVRLEAFGLPDELPPTVVDGEGNDDNDDDDIASSLFKTLAKSKQKADEAPSEKKKDNKAMDFLKKMGKVGGAANKNFVNAVGSDEGPSGRNPPAERGSGGSAGGLGSDFRKAKAAYEECTVSGTIDDMTEVFPFTSSGLEWRGISDRVMGGVSNGFVKRELDLEGRPANVLMGHVSLKNNGGFIQMVTDLALDPVKNSGAVDASQFDGIEIDALFRHVTSSSKVNEEEPEQVLDGEQTFNMHLRTPGTFQQTSYRHTLKLSQPNKWETILIPFTSFSGYNVAEPLDISKLRRIGIVSIGEEMDVFLAVGGVRFYSVF